MTAGKGHAIKAPSVQTLAIKELPFTVENGATKLSIPGKKTLTVTF
ncbi:MAG: hypothetical protein IKY18_04735 [Oscillospiraceae bacterium]|nr:hypothetical protein [Oscillospiraceae bacterium]